MKIKLREQINNNLTQYAEVVKSGRFIEVENFSLEFMVGHNADFNEFRNGIILFRETLLNTKVFVFGKSTLLIEQSKHKGKMINLASISKLPNAFTGATFFAESSKNKWMVNKIIEYIDKGVAVALCPGVVVVGNNPTKVILGREFIGV